MPFTKPQLLEKFRLMDEKEHVRLGKVSEEFGRQGRGLDSICYEALADVRVQTMTEKMTHLRDADMPLDEKREMAPGLKSEVLGRIQGELHRVPDGGPRLNLSAKLERIVQHAFDSALLDLEAHWNQQKVSASGENQPTTQNVYVGTVVQTGSGAINIGNNIQALNQEGHLVFADALEAIRKWTEATRELDATRRREIQEILGKISAQALVQPDARKSGIVKSMIETLKLTLETANSAKDFAEKYSPLITSIFHYFFPATGA